VGSIQGDVDIRAGEAYRQLGSSVVAPQGDISITAPIVEIGAVMDTAQSRQTFEAKQSGLTLSVSNPVVSAVQTAQQMNRAAGQTGDTRMKALAAATTALTAKNAYDAVLKDPGQLGGINIGVSLGSSKSQSESSQSSSMVVGSNVAAGNNLTVQATAGDLTAIGSTLSAGNNASLLAAGNLNLLAAANSSSSQSSSSGSGSSIGVGFGLGPQGAGLSVSASANKSSGNSNGNDTTWTGTQVSAGNIASLDSGSDTTLRGATVSGKQVVAEVGTSGQGNLNIESLQDSSTYRESGSSSGFGVSVPIGGGTGFSASLNASQTKINSDYQSANTQSGIKAGDEGFQVNVASNTDLRGAVIASSDKAVLDGKNSLSTGTLTTSDIQNRADASAQASGINLSTDMFTQGKYGMAKGVIGNALNNASESGSSSGQTRSAVSAGEVIITDEARQIGLTGKSAEATVASLNRDTANAQTAAQKLDVQAMKQKVLAEQTIKNGAFTAVTINTDDAYNARFKTGNPLYLVTCNTTPEACLADPSSKNITQKEITLE
jgi:filamentous hemagglutinin